MAGKPATTRAKTKIKAKRALCGVPALYCEGSPTRFSAGMTSTKSHSNHPEAFRCHANYLTKVLGFKKVGSREFEPPDGKGPIRVLTKQSRFGSLVRGGKEDRYMGNYDFTGGTLVS